MPDSKWQDRLAISLIWGAHGGAMGYLALRMFEVLTQPEVSPTLILRTEHVGYYWRVMSALFWALAAGLTAWKAGPTLPSRWLTHGVLLVTVALFWLFP